MKIGFIGLGIMGSRMAANLQKHSYEMVVHNRTAERADELVAAGAVWADTPAAAGREADIVITVLAHPEAVSEAALGGQSGVGFLESLRPGTIWIDCSTVNPSFARDMANQAQSRGIRFLDAPVAGSKGAAQAGALIFLVGGDIADFEACRPVFAAMGREAKHIGSVGMGAALKMVNNLLGGLTVASFSEAVAFAVTLGLPRQTVLTYLAEGMLGSAFLKLKSAKIESGDFEADFPLKWMQKDLHLASLSAYETGAALPMGNLAKELYRLAMRDGLGDADFAAIYQFLSHDDA